MFHMVRSWKRSTSASLLPPILDLCTAISQYQRPQLPAPTKRMAAHDVSLRKPEARADSAVAREACHCRLGGTDAGGRSCSRQTRSDAKLGRVDPVAYCRRADHGYHLVARPADHRLRRHWLDPARARVERPERTRDAGRHFQRHSEGGGALLEPL